MAPAWSQTAAVEPVEPAQADITDTAPQQKGYMAALEAKGYAVQNPE